MQLVSVQAVQMKAPPADPLTWDEKGQGLRTTTPAREIASFDLRQHTVMSTSDGTVIGTPPRRSPGRRVRVLGRLRRRHDTEQLRRRRAGRTERHHQQRRRTRTAACAIRNRTPVAADTVGTFEGARYYRCRMYRPQFDCMMRNLSAFCAVCPRRIRQTPITILILSLFRQLRYRIQNCGEVTASLKRAVRTFAHHA